MKSLYDSWCTGKQKSYIKKQYQQKAKSQKPKVGKLAF